MISALFSRSRRALAEPSDPEPWPESGETWMPEGVTVLERYWNQANAVLLVYSADERCYHHVVACLGCHFNVAHDPNGSREYGLKLDDAGRIANEHATSCRALSRAIPERPDDDVAREQLRTWALSWQREGDRVEIYVRSFGLHRLILQRSNEWIEAELQRLAVDHPDVFATQRSDYGDQTTFYYYVLFSREK